MAWMYLTERLQAVCCPDRPEKLTLFVHLALCYACRIVFPCLVVGFECFVVRLLYVYAKD